MQALLDRQRAAFLRAGPPDLASRKAQLQRLKRAVLDYRQRVKEAISADFGNRSHQETDLMEIIGIVEAIDYLSANLRSLMRPERRQVGLVYQAGRAFVEYQPKGVVGIMAPWNYPFSLMMVPLATALAAGNRALLKPSELTPRTSQVIHQLVAGSFAAEEVAVVIGDAAVGAQFAGLAFDHLLFTGSTEVGRKVMQAASRNLVPLTLELGGKSPAILAEGAISRNAIDALIFGKLSNAGQTCVAPDYVFVHENDMDLFIREFDAGVKRAYPNGPNSPDYTSIINERHFARLNSLIADARASGAEIIELGINPSKAHDRPRTLAPSLVIGADSDARILSEEIFGPVLPVLPWRSIEEVSTYVNARPRPLALYYFGPLGADYHWLLSHTTSGNVGINNCMLHVAQADLPFGGIGASGMGAYHGPEGFRAMTHAKGVFIQHGWNLPRLLRPPFGRLVDFALRVTLGRPRK